MSPNEALRKVLDISLPLDCPINEGEADDMIALLAEYGFEIVPKPPAQETKS